MHQLIPVLLIALLCVAPAWAEQVEPIGIGLEGYEYPHPVQFLPLDWNGRRVNLAYMDVNVPGEPQGTVLLLHGKNFFGAYWRSTIEELASAGYRVVVPDQIGFGKSSKPEAYYTFEALAQQTASLLDALEIDRVTVVGHSMGGMLATRFTLMYPERVAKLVLENPIGLEDYREKAPYAPLDQTYRNELAQTPEKILSYHRTYYVTWKDAYAEWPTVVGRVTLGSEFPRWALASALTYEMIYTQPVVHDLPRVRVPTLLIIGQEDRTAIGKASVPEDVRATMGQYPELGRRTVEAIPGAELVELEGVGHIPHLESPERFHEALLGFLWRP